MYVLPSEASEAEFRELLSYWQSKLAPGRLPGRQHIDPTELQPRHLSQLLLLDVVEAAPPEKRTSRCSITSSTRKSCTPS